MVLSNLVVKGFDGDLDDAVHHKWFLILGLQAPRYFIADSRASCHMTSSRYALEGFELTDSYAIRTANEVCMTVMGVGKLDLLFPTDDERFIVTPDRTILVIGLANDLFSLCAMDRSGHKFVVSDDDVNCFDCRLRFCAKGNLYRRFAYRLTRRHVRDEMNELSKDDDDSSVDANGEISSDGEITKAAELTPVQATSSVTTNNDINNHQLMLGHLSARLLKESADKSGITLHGQWRT